MIFEKKKIFVWCDDPQEDPVISVFAGCLANHDRAHSLYSLSKVEEYPTYILYSILQIYNLFPHCAFTSVCDPWSYRHGIISHHSAVLYLRDIYIHIYHML